MNILDKRPLYQVVLMSLLFVVGLPLYGQVSNTYVLQATDGEIHEKMVYEVVRSLDPEALVSISGQHLKVRLDASIEVAELISDLGTNGGGNFAIDVLATQKATANNFPILKNTGAPAHDEAVYNAEKQAWIQAHPEVYKAMNEQEPLKNE
ncbi:MAG: hypothetical protein IPI00_00650 [Flavobacteriales bacterium]|nr:hypothetical protein [Flavobacteriales bacterium]MBK6946341.1 hypothetical protein [Flavobacteriales bacterium]MBK7238699.1 hypothetical protein [Flavobacteriales bacterium]MBK7297725.1 hypothetical protein [Flavobacteriales bacterium]MBK9536389.1 hypothetical protein [Flavobacteriales bacterium]